MITDKDIEKATADIKSWNHLGRQDLQPGDIKKSLHWYRQKYNRRARSIGVHISNNTLANEIPFALTIYWCEGIPRSQVWISPSKDFEGYKWLFARRVGSPYEGQGNIQTDYHPTGDSIASDGIVINAEGHDKRRGMPRVDLPWEKIKELQSQGKTKLQIIRELGLPQAATYRAMARQAAGEQ